MSHLPLMPVGIELDERPDNFPEGFQVLGVPVGQQFAVTPELSRDAGYTGNWRATHIPTGRSLSRHAACFACALRAAGYADRSGVDWTKTMDELRRDHAARELREQVDQMWFDCSNDETCSHRSADLQSAALPSTADSDA